MKQAILNLSLGASVMVALAGCVTDSGMAEVEESPNLMAENGVSSQQLAQDSWTNCENGVDFPEGTGQGLPVRYFSAYQTIETASLDLPPPAQLRGSQSVPSAFGMASPLPEPDTPYIPGDDSRPKHPAIINGVGVDDAEDFPWIAHLKIVMSDGVNEYISQCGGSLVDDRWVMTAAHCLSVPEAEAALERTYNQQISLDLVRVDVGMGSTDVDSMSWTTATKAYCHAQYDQPVRLNNDIAMLELDSPVDTTPATIGLATLPPQGQDLLSSTTSNFLTVPIGWGLTETNQVSPTLVKTQLLADVSSADPYEFTAGSGQAYQSICSGDSGGPNHVGVTSIPGSGTVIGLSSYVRIPVGAYGCNYQNVPSIFTRVSSYRDAVDAAVLHCGNGSTCQ